MSDHAGTRDTTKPCGGFLSIGNFDGVHLGHQAILAQLKQRANATNVSATVMTFDPHPVALLAPRRVPPRLTTTEQKVQLLRRYGADEVIVYPTSPELLAMTPEEFFTAIVREQVGACGMVEGPNFFFGRGRTGNVDTLRQLCEAAGLTLDVVEAKSLGDTTVSSSSIRAALLEGRVEEAARRLGRPYAIVGVVSTGAQRGRELGFPTANLTEVATLLPAEGVYGGRCEVAGKSCLAAIHIGANPTFDDAERKVEVHLLDFEGDLYGQTLTVEFLQRIRGTQTFPDVHQLRDQLLADIARIRATSTAAS